MRVLDLRPRRAVLAAALSLSLAVSAIPADIALGVTSWYTVERFCWPGPCVGTATAGSPVAFIVTARKFTQNPWTSYTGKVKFASTDPQAVLPATYAFTQADHGDHGFTVTFKTAGPQTITVTDVLNAAMHGTSDPLMIEPAAAHHLDFSTQPTGAQAGSPLGTQPRVQVHDAYGNRVPSSAAVSLGLVPPPGVVASLTCASGTVVAAVNGTVVYTGCSVDQPGTGFIMVATSPGLAAGTSAPFDITAGPAPSPTPTPTPGPSASPTASPSPPATAIVLTASPTTVTWPGATVLTVALAGAGTGRLVRVERRDAGSAEWSLAGTITTDAFSAGTLEYIPNRTAEYRAVWPGDASLPAATSAAVPVAVRFLVIISPANTTRTTTAGRSLAWTATLRPVTAGVVVRFRVFRYVGGAWVQQTVSTKVTSTTGKATFTQKFAAAGRYYMQVTAFAGPANSSASAAKKYVTVNRARR
jgi:hypothetical protein